MRRSILFFFLVFLIGLLGGQTGVFASDNGNLTSSEKSKISKHMKEDGATQKDIDNVINKLEKGEELDAYKTDEQKAFFSNDELEDAANNSTTDKNPEKTYWYDDGSYIKLKLDVENDESKETKIDTNAANGTFKTIKATGSGPFGKASYRAKIYIDTHLGNDYIDKIYDKEIHMLGSYSNVNFKISRKYENRSQDITAKSFLYFDWKQGSTMKSSRLRVHAGDKINDQYGIWVSFTDGSASYK